jgi:hypothetical protein
VIDAGALNGSRVNRENKHLQDPFDCYLSDIHDANVWRSRLYARCRRNSIQTAIRALEIPDEEIERVLWGKGSTAWRLYDSKPVRIEEMSAVATYLSGRLQMIEDNHPVRQMAAFNQPVVEVLRRGKGRKVDHISRKELYEIIDEIASALQASNLAAMATAVGHALRSVYYLGSRDIRPFKDLISKLDEIS